MKKLLLLIIILFNIITLEAQTIASDFLDINNIKARINADGSLFNDYASVYYQGFQVPKTTVGNGPSTIYAGGLWIGGFDGGGALKLAAQTYKQGGVDFWSGPLSPTATTDSPTIAAYNKVWKLNKCDIDLFHNWVIGGATGSSPVNSVILNNILTWPVVGLGNQNLAPYFDYNSNGIYDPYLGDYPLIKGDQAIFFVINDKGGVHGESQGDAIGIEVQGMAYAYNCTTDSALNNTIFTNYKIFNRSSVTLDSVYIGNWTDFDIGSATDDYIGCDVTRGAYYAYNGDLIDDNPPPNQIPYGANPPAQAVVFLKGPNATTNGIDDAAILTSNGTNYGDGIIDNERLGMSKFLYYNHFTGATGDPSLANHYYRYLKGIWKDGNPLSYGGSGYLSGVKCNYMFPGASDPSGYGINQVPQAPWSELTAGNIPDDRSGLGSFGPFTLLPGLVQEIDFAYVYGRAISGGNQASVTVMEKHIDSVRQKFNKGISACGCLTATDLEKLSKENTFTIYPNPASQTIILNITTTSKNCEVKIYDATSRLVKNFENITAGENNLTISELDKGFYFLNVRDNGNSLTKPFVKE